MSVKREEEQRLAQLRHRMRHSTSHVMADIVLRLFPDAKLGIGPPTEDGFYSDFDVPRLFTPDLLLESQSLLKVPRF